MTIVIDGSGTITGASTLATTVASPTLTTPIVTTTIGVGGATPSASGSGITFPATQSASTDANTLDDYEEGTWTPSYLGLTSAGTTTYGVNKGIYVKVGQMITVTGVMTWTAATGTGGAALGGLPFVINNSNGESDGSVWIGTESGYTMTGQLGAFLIRAGTTATLQVYNNGSASAANVINGSVALRFAFSYRSN